MGKRLRVEDYGTEFGGPTKTAVGWSIPVPEVFRARLDIALTPRNGGARWTQGQPPQYTFTTGDVFYDPPDVRSMRWGDALLILRRIVKINDATPDILEGDQVRSGSVTFSLCHYADGHVVETFIHTVTQKDFVAFLRAGAFPEAVTVDKTLVSAKAGMAQAVCLQFDDGRRLNVIPTGIIRKDAGRYAYLNATDIDGSPRSPIPIEFINAVVDGDGEVHEIPMAYFRGAAGLSLPEPGGNPGERLKEEVKRGLRILLAIANSDGPLTEKKRDVLFDYVRTRADLVHVPASPLALEKIAAMLPRMRPSRAVVQAALMKQAMSDRHKWPIHHGLLTKLSAQMAQLCSGGNGVDTILADIAAATDAPELGTQAHR